MISCLCSRCLLAIAVPFLFDRICWAFSVYTLFILTCAHWILHVYYIMLFFLQKINSMEQYITKNHCPCHIQVLETRGQMLTAFKSWFVAWYGHFLWNCPNIYPHRFLLLLCQRLVLSFFPVDDHLCFGFPRIVLHVVWNKFFQSILFSCMYRVSNLSHKNSR